MNGYGRKNIAIRALIVIAAIGVGVVVNTSLGEQASDRLISKDVAADPRIVVVTFDKLGDFGTGVVPHLRATFYRDIALQARQNGARAVGFVDFDSLSFSDGEGGRSNVVASDAIQSIAVIPLIDASSSSSDHGKIPLLRSYRVDPLASEVAGVGVPLNAHSGVIRTIPAVARATTLEDGAIVSTVDFELKAANRNAVKVVPGFALRLIELATSAPITSATAHSVDVGQTKVPLEEGSMRIRWSNRLDSTADVPVIPHSLLATVPVEVFHDAIILVATVDPANTTYVDTPVGPLPPVLVYANAINTVLGQHFVQPAPKWPGLLGAALAAVMLIFVPTKRWWVPTALAVGVGVAWLLVARQLADGGRLIATLTVPVAAIATVALSAARTQVAALAERRHLRLLFAQYVPASVANQLATSGRGQTASEGERLAVTTLFCDLRGFTPLSARLEPTRVRQLLDIYYEELASIAFQANGTVLQFTGDEIFAVFGAPVPMPDHASAALSCARLMFEAQAHLNATLADVELPGLNYGIGVHSGVVVAAHVGSSIHRQYSVIGDTVNIGSRHCSLAREGQIVVSDAAGALLGDVPGATRVDGVAIKGTDGTHSLWLIQAGPNVTSGSPELSLPLNTEVDVLETVWSL